MSSPAPWVAPARGGWSRRRLRTLGQTYSGSGFPPALQGAVDLEVPFYKVKHLGQASAGGVLGNPDDTITRETAVSLGATVFPAGSLVYAKVGAALMLGRVRTLPSEACIDNNMAGLIPNAEVDSRFLYWAMSQVRFDYLVNPGAVPSLSDSKLMDYPLPLPSRELQRGIADYLDRETARIDTLIEEQQRLIELLRERRRAVVQNALAGDGHGWSVDKLGRRTQIGNGSTPRRDNWSYWSDDGFPWLNSAVVNLDFIESSDQFVTDVALAECHLPVVEPGSVLVGLTGQGKTRGKATLLATVATVNQHLAYVTPESNFWDSRFLLWTMRAAYDDLRAVSDENGSTKGGLTCADLKSFRVAHPELDEQRRIAAFLDDQTTKIDELIAESERFIELSRERQAALITAAVTGQIDVREVA